MRITIRELREIIREVLEQDVWEKIQYGGYELNEKLDWKGGDAPGRYTIVINHPKTFEVPGQEPEVIPDYETSTLEAKISGGEMVVTWIKVAVPKQKIGKEILVKRAMEKARELGLKFKGSGLYTDAGKAMVASLVQAGLLDIKDV